MDSVLVVAVKLHKIFIQKTENYFLSRILEENLGYEKN